ncbi:hypothetical protein [Gelria sp. Kuro-4]|uniref:hypothetical protein n=1 Tax=Gelria sp. Kuro-4 TaxID=2796927 RepID=UPI001BEF1268|nr:hypothetical protein [Gelria sp. Kuro-4]BCV23290.1 hypothetical protein kuro4_00630 [Gelria sp. Kuro-4]
MAFTVLLDNVQANGPGTSLDCRGYHKATVLLGSSFTADVKFEASLDGSNWFPFMGKANGSLDTGMVSSPSYVRFDVEGIAYLRPVVANYRTGTVYAVGFAENVVVDAPSIAAVKYTLAASTPVTVKASPGSVYRIGTALTDLIVKDGSTDIWAGAGDFSSAPLRCSTSIVLSSATGGDVYIQYV